MVKNRGKIKRIWFMAKEYGWGWYPISWQGWLSIGVFVLFYVIVLVWLLNQKNMLNVIFGILALLIILNILFFICYKKGEKPGWRWKGKLLKNETRRNKK